MPTPTAFPEERSKMDQEEKSVWCSAATLNGLERD
jgi:hypothetical protein